MKTLLGRRLGPSLGIGDNNVRPRGIAQETEKKKKKSSRFNRSEVLERKLQWLHNHQHNEVHSIAHGLLSFLVQPTCKEQRSGHLTLVKSLGSSCSLLFYHHLFQWGQQCHRMLPFGTPQPETELKSTIPEETPRGRVWGYQALS